MVAVQPETQIVERMSAGVTTGLTAPGVRTRFGRIAPTALTTAPPDVVLRAPAALRVGLSWVGGLAAAPGAVSTVDRGRGGIDATEVTANVPAAGRPGVGPPAQPAMIITVETSPAVQADHRQEHRTCVTPALPRRESGRAPR
jgi:hypothetical protein